MTDDAPRDELVVHVPARLDAVVQRARPSLSRRLVRQMFVEGAVRVNGRPAPKGRRVLPGDRVSLPVVPPLAPEPALDLPVVWEDAYVVAVEKPGGMPSHALDPRQRGTAAAFILARWPETADVGEPLAAGLVHRLDTGTSGLLLAARTPAAWDALRTAFRARRVTKRYLAVVAGEPPAETTVRLALAHEPGARGRMRAARAGERSWPATTHLRCLALLPHGRALVEAEIRTGVTHQVRAHCAALGCPVVGDAVYGGPAAPPLGAGRHALHAADLVVDAALWPTPLRLHSPLPADLRALCSA